MPLKTVTEVGEYLASIARTLEDGGISDDGGSAFHMFVAVTSER